MERISFVIHQIYFPGGGHREYGAGSCGITWCGGAGRGDWGSWDGATGSGASPIQLVGATGGGVGGAAGGARVRWGVGGLRE